MSRTRAKIAEGEALLALSLKRCGVCGNVLHLDEFYSGIGLGGRRPACKPCHMEKTVQWRAQNLPRVRQLGRKESLSPERLEARREINRRYAARNRLKQVEKSRAYREAKREKLLLEAPEKAPRKRVAKTADEKRAQCRAWKKRNPDKCREYARRAISTPMGRIKNRIRSRVRESLRNGWPSGGQTFVTLGYTCAELRTHLERQFIKGMSWQNMSEWHIDHIRPMSSFRIAGPDDPEFRRAWGLTNLRPLWGADNMSKGARIVSLL